MRFRRITCVALFMTIGMGQPAAGGEAPAGRSEATLDARRVVSDVRRIIADRYVLPEMRAPIDAVLATGLSSGRYLVNDPAVLAERVSFDIARVSKDHHLYFRFDPERVATIMAQTGDARPDATLHEAQVRSANHGVRELKLLPGNVRYLDLASFEWIGPESEAALNAAMAFLKDGHAIIIDLRRNGGGSGRAVHQVTGHLVAADTPLISFHKGEEASPVMTSLPNLSTMVGKPLYVLTSQGTGSAAEELVGHVAGYKLGEIVGEATSGAAYMNGLHAIEGGFELSVSEARPVLAATGKDWEKVGIAPTIPVAPQAALGTAHLAAVRALAAADPDPTRRARLAALAAGLEGIAHPAIPGAALAAYVGSYGDRQIFEEAGKLWYRQEQRMAREMVPLGGDQFTLVDDPLVRVAFRSENHEMSGFSLGLAEGPVQGRFERDR